MAFNQFPYSNFHELNLDWLLNKVKEIAAGMDDLETAFKALKEWVDNYFEQHEVAATVTDILTKWKDDGTLKRALYVPFKASCYGWLGFIYGTNIAKNDEILNMGSMRHCALTADNVHKFSTAEFYYSDRFTFPTDMPIDRAIIVANTDSRFFSVYSCNYDTTHVSLVLGTPIKYTYPLNVAARIMVNARRAHPAKSPKNGIVDGATGNRGALDCALSFLHARESGRKFAYGSNFMYTSSNKLNNGDGAGLVECDNIAMMALLGIDYDHSPYTNDAADATFNFDDLVVNPKSLYPWTAITKTLVKQSDGAWTNGLNQRITNTSTLGWWWWNNKQVFSDITQLHDGDIAIFRRPPAQSAEGVYDTSGFDNIGHVGVVGLETDGTPYIIHATVEEWTDGNVIVKSPLADFYNLAPLRYRPEDTYFARIDFSAT